MSLEFNRRSFLKYSAAAAVAVAGSSLLVGCGEDEYQKTGKIGSTLKLMGTFKMITAMRLHLLLPNAYFQDHHVGHINIMYYQKGSSLCNQGLF